MRSLFLKQKKSNSKNLDSDEISCTFLFLEKNVFSSCRERGTKKKSESPWGIELQTCGFRKKTSLSISLPSSKLTFSRSYIYNRYAFDIADPNSSQDACHMNFIIDLAHRRVSVAQWLEHRSAESEGFSKGTQNFFFVQQNIFFYFFTELKPSQTVPSIVFLSTSLFLSLFWIDSEEIHRN